MTLLLTKVFAILRGMEAQSLIWNMFCNTNGGKGKTFPLTLGLNSSTMSSKYVLRYWEQISQKKTPAHRIARPISNMEKYPAKH